MIQHNTIWNLFAGELQTILRFHNMELSSLDNTMGIHREKVRRLQQSLSTPPQLPVLNPEELQVVIETLQLDEDEILRLHTALLITAVQRMLGNRIHPDDTLLAAQQLQPTMRDALTRYAAENGLGNTRTGDIEPIDDNDFDYIIATVSSTFDRGEEALNTSYYATYYVEQLHAAQYASACFDSTLTGLRQMDSEIRLSSGWQTWNDSVQEAQARARQRLQELGA